MSKTCKWCKSKLNGRSDKIFCSINCKNNYHVKLRQVTGIVTAPVDKILHRNRSILLEIMGKNKVQIKIERMVLDKKKFNFNYITGYSVNKENKVYQHVYDFSYMTFSDKTVLIIRKKQ